MKSTDTDTVGLLRSDSSEGYPSAQTYLNAAQAEATRRVYAKDVDHFISWGGRIPASPDVVMQYLAEIATKLAVATIERRTIALHRAHTDAGFESPIKHPMVKRLLQGIRRTKGTRQRQVRPIIKDDLLQMLVMVDLQRPHKAARDKALLLIGFAGAFRRSELVAIRCEDITHFPNGAEILLRHSKTDQEKSGRTVFIPQATGKHCPVKALAAWQSVSGITEGYVFRAVNRHDQISDKPLSAQSVALIVKQAIQFIGVDHHLVSGHSLRAGYCTQAAIVGLQPFQIREQTGHRSDAMLARYIRPVAKRKIPSLL